MKTPKVVKGISKILGVIILFTLCWFIIYRVTSSTRQLKTVHLDVAEGRPSADSFLRIGAYNIAHGRGAETAKSNLKGGSEKERLERLDKMGALIQAHNLDLLILNEVDFDCSWSQGVNQAAYLAERAGFPYVTMQRNVDMSAPFYKISIGNAVLSKFPVLRSKFIPYPALNVREEFITGHKNGCYVDVEFSRKRTLRVFPVHFEYRDRENRQQSLDALLPYKTDLSIWAGDFNTGLDKGSVVDRLITETFSKTSPSPSLTFPTSHPKRVLDWIIVPQAWSHKRSQVITSSYSDHALVVHEWKVEP